MTTGKPGLPVSERALRVFGHHRPSKKGASLRKEGVNFSRARRSFFCILSLLSIVPMEFTTECNESFHYFRTCSPSEISSLVATEIPQDQLPLAYLNSLSADDKTVCLRATMICWVMSKMTMVPREMQLRVVLADVHSKDALIAAGTGSGKTLPIALCILLDNPTANFLSITVSPLKRLQVTQESDFNNRFGIPTVTINEDTPRDSEWWNVSTRNISPVYTH